MEKGRQRRPKVLLFVRPAAGGMREEFLCLAKWLAREEFQLIGCGPSDFYLIEGFHAAEVPYQPLRLSPWPVAALQLSRLVASERPSLVHSHGLYAAGLAHLVLRTLPRVRHVVTIHTLLSAGRLRGLAGWAGRALSGRALRAADAVIAVSRAAQESVEALFPALRGKVQVIYNGVDIEPLLEPVDRGAMVQLFRLRADCPHVGVIARLSQEKGVQYFLRAAHLLSAEGLQVDYVIAGDGPLRRDLTVLAHGLGIAGEVRFLGEQPHIASVLAVLDVLVIPSLSESFSLVAVKAAVLGTPIVASRVGGLPEVLPESMARFVPPGDANALADAIRETLDGLSAKPEEPLEGLDLALSSLALGLRTGMDLDEDVPAPYVISAADDDPRVVLAERFAPERTAWQVQKVYRRLLSGQSRVGQA